MYPPPLHPYTHAHNVKNVVLFACFWVVLPLAPRRKLCNRVYVTPDKSLLTQRNLMRRRLGFAMFSSPSKYVMPESSLPTYPVLVSIYNVVTQYVA
jgi:hypothetical protein